MKTSPVRQGARERRGGADEKMMAAARQEVEHPLDSVDGYLGVLIGRLEALGDERGAGWGDPARQAEEGDCGRFFSN